MAINQKRPISRLVYNGIDIPVFQKDEQLILDELTSDGTARSEDIAAGRIAYVKGEKIIGSNSLKKMTADATATSTDIAMGKTAYINGVKITGKLQAIDTSDATATPEDVVENKTFYADGKKLTGTLSNYGVSQYYTGSEPPAASVGEDGDLFFVI